MLVKNSQANSNKNNVMTISIPTMDKKQWIANMGSRMSQYLFFLFCHEIGIKSDPQNIKHIS